MDYVQVVNQTVNNTIGGLGGITFEKASEITSSLPMVIAFGLVWFLPLLIYFLWGACASARTSDGRKLSSKVISNANFWIGAVIFGLIQLALFLVVVIFPVWLIPFQ
jgi:hypothetical protein